MTRAWQLQEAKNRFSEVVDQAAKEGPQVVTRRGVETAVVLSFEDYQKLSRPEKNLADFFRTSPLAGKKVKIVRSRDVGRKVVL